MSRPLTVVRNLPLTASVLGLHVGRAGSKATSVVLRRCPRALRALVATAVVRAVRPDLAALAVAADGRSAEARALVRQAIELLSPLQDPERPAPPSRRRDALSRRRLAHAAVVMHDLPLAQQALTGDHLAGDPPTAIVRSVVAAAQGHLDAAIAHLDGLETGAARRLRAQLAGEREVLGTTLLLEALAAAPAPPKAVPGASPSAKVASVLHVVSGALPDQQSGYTIRTHGILTAQRSAGLDARAVTRLGFPVDIGVLAAPSEVSHENVPYYRLLPPRGIPIPGTARQRESVKELTALVTRFTPAVLHAHSKHENAQIALIVGRQRGIPVVYEARGFLEETWVSTGGSRDSDRYRWNRRAETRCMSQADVVVTLSTAMADDIIDRGLDASRVMVVPNAVDSRFAQRPPEDRGEHRLTVRATTRRALGIPTDAVVFGTVSTLNDYEGLDTVVEAVARMKDPAVWVLVVGNGAARSELAAQASAAGVADRVVFTGRIAHARVRDHLDAMNVFVVPRKATPVTALVPPIKPLEAMAVGLPILASDLPPLVEIVQPGSFGHVATAQDPAAWAEQMAALRYAPDHLEDLGTSAAAFVAAERTWSRAVDRYAGIYAMAVAR